MRAIRRAAVTGKLATRGRRIPDPELIRGIARMRASLGVALAVMVALALGHVRAGRPESMRLLFAAVPFADIG